MTFEIDGEPGTYRRVPEVIDAWFDSGSMPFAQWGYPHVAGLGGEVRAGLPGPVHLRGHRPDPRLVLLADGGRHAGVRAQLVRVGRVPRAHPRRGRPQDEQAPRQHPAADAAHGRARRRRPALVHGLLGVAVVSPAASATPRCRRSSARCSSPTGTPSAFHVLYARADGLVARRRRRRRRSPSARCSTGGSSSRRTAWRRTSRIALETFDTQRAGGQIAAVRRRPLQLVRPALPPPVLGRRRRRPSRRCTRRCTSLTLLMAPLTPFITERVWQDLFRADVTGAARRRCTSPRWPKVDAAWSTTTWPPDGDSPAGSSSWAAPRAPRPRSKTRQPLRRALVASAAWHALGEDLRAQVCEELNIGVARVARRRRRGPRRPLAPRATSATSASVRQGDAEGRRRHRRSRRRALAASLAPPARPRSTSTARRSSVGPDDVIISERPREGWSVVNDQGETVALDLELDDELRRAGLAREIVRAVQEARKASGLESPTASPCAGPVATPSPPRCASTPTRSPTRCSPSASPRTSRPPITATTTSGCASRSPRPDGNAKSRHQSVTALSGVVRRL